MLTTRIPEADVVRPPGEVSGRGARPFTHPLKQGGKRFSVIHVWLGYASYEIEAAADGPDAQVERVTCTAIPRDRRSQAGRLQLYSARLVADDGSTVSAVAMRMLFAMVQHEAAHNK